MRAKTTDFLKVLNRARPEPSVVEKKTITYVLELDEPQPADNVVKFAPVNDTTDVQYKISF